MNKGCSKKHSVLKLKDFSIFKKYWRGLPLLFFEHPLAMKIDVSMLNAFRKGKNTVVVFVVVYRIISCRDYLQRWFSELNRIWLFDRTP